MLFSSSRHCLRPAGQFEVRFGTEITYLAAISSFLSLNDLLNTGFTNLSERSNRALYEMGHGRGWVM